MLSAPALYWPDEDQINKHTLYFCLGHSWDEYSLGECLNLLLFGTLGQTTAWHVETLRTFTVLHHQYLCCLCFCEAPIKPKH